ncbi:MAG: EamA family transporter [Lawsonibacter sp.]|jgi:drug/metabolite transporter (DMT)-like permease|nr:EamA family transporter [Lawsonibacter sp.]
MIYLAVLAMTLIGAMGAFFLKAGMDRVDSLPALFRTPQIYLGGGFYLAGAGLNILLLHQLDYSVLYPMTAVTYVWSMLLSAAFLGESLTRRKLIGVAAVVLGVAILSR